MPSDKPGEVSEEAYPAASYLSASPRLFDNWILDQLSRMHWSMPLYFYVPVVVVLAGLSFAALDFAPISWQLHRDSPVDSH